MSIKRYGQHYSDILDAAWPVGSIYFELRNKSSPSQLGLPGVWEAQTNNGRFFRGEGGNAVGLNGTQSYATTRIRGHFRSGRAGSGWGSGVFYESGSYGGVKSGAHTSPRIYFDNSRKTSTANEVRPYNETIRIWQRTS